jgi:hypothetical protein
VNGIHGEFGPIKAENFWGILPKFKSFLQDVQK